MMKKIFAAEKYGIRRADVDPSVIKIVTRLHNFGYQAYIVGGAVRDLLVGLHPKDFDVATDARPNRIRRLFRNSRVIGKRFRLVHVYFADGKIIEVSTFRSRDSEGFQNMFGTIEEDVLRRDFTANALFYNPKDNTLVDYVDGLRDITTRRLRAVIPLDSIFTEDPVRMIRAIKYSSTTGLHLTFFLRQKIRRSAHLLANCSESRLSEELFKVLLSGHAAEIMRLFLRYGLLAHIQLHLLRRIRRHSNFARLFFESLKTLDAERANFEGTYGRDQALGHYLASFIHYRPTLTDQDEEKNGFEALYSDARAFLHPIVPAYVDLRSALVQLAPLCRPTPRRRRNSGRGYRR